MRNARVINHEALSAVQDGNYRSGGGVKCTPTAAANISPTTTARRRRHRRHSIGTSRFRRSDSRSTIGLSEPMIDSLLDANVLCLCVFYGHLQVGFPLRQLTNGSLLLADLRCLSHCVDRRVLQASLYPSTDEAEKLLANGRERGRRTSRFRRSNSNFRHHFHHCRHGNRRRCRRYSRHRH